MTEYMTMDGEVLVLVMVISWQASSTHIYVPAPSIAANILQALDVLTDCASQVPLYNIVIDLLSQLGELFFTEILGPLVVNTLNMQSLGMRASVMIRLTQSGQAQQRIPTLHKARM